MVIIVTVLNGIGYGTAARVFRKAPLYGTARTVHARKVAVGIIRIAVRHVTW